MIYLYAFLAGILPAIFLVVFIYWKDKYQREPWSWIGKAFYYGVRAAVLSIIIELGIGAAKEFMGLSGLALSAFDAFAVAALPEECTKWLFFWLLVRKNPYFDERMDGIVYACCVSMGFAGVENVMYMFSNLDDLAGIAIVRAVLSVPGHFFFAVFMGYYYSLAAFGCRSHRRRNLFLSLMVPFILHGAFDFGLFSMNISTETAMSFFMLFVIVCVYCWKIGLRRIRATLELEAPESDKEYE